MENINNDISTLSDLLERYQASPTVVLAHLCPQGDCENFLMAEVIKKVKNSCRTKINYIKLSPAESKAIRTELMINKSPVLLLIDQGIIKGIYTGHIGYNQLCQAIDQSISQAS